MFIFIQGCAHHVSQASHDYSKAWPQLDINTLSQVIVNVEDVRPYVLDGTKTRSFIGLQRDGYGVPWSIETTSNRALSTDVQLAITRGLNNSGIMAKGLNKDDKSHDKDRLIYIYLHEWKSDTYSSTRFIYDLRCVVKDVSGNILGKSQVSGSSATADVIDKGRTVLTELLNAQGVKNTLD
jgi:hypothetical protein